MTTRSVRTTLELTLNPGYVRDWGKWEAIREFLQNAIDADDKGFESEITYVTNTKEPQLRIVNNGITIDRDTLLFGTTSKADDPSQRGKFGEGMKLAMLVLLREGLKVKIRSGNEQWIPRFDYSGNFNSELLMIDTSPCKYRNAIQIDVIGLEENVWEDIKSKVILLSKTKKQDILKIYNDNILTDDQHKNKLFVKGIFVGRLPGNFFFGYDIDDIEIDRDRKMVDSYDLKYKVQGILARAVDNGQLKISAIMDILDCGYDEARAIEDCTYNSNVITQQLAAAFVEKHGPDAVAVMDTVQSVEAQKFGYLGIIVSPVLKSAIDIELGSFEDRKKSRKLEVKYSYGAHELSNEESDNLIWAQKLLKSNAGEDFETLSIVEFFDTNVKGVFKGGNIALAKSIMTDKEKVILVAIHEIAHSYGGDATIQHEMAKDRIAARIITNLCKEKM